MLTNLLKVALRNIIRNKVYSLINIFGLAIGTFASMIICWYVQFEFSYDKFNHHIDELYRINYQRIKNNETNFESAAVFKPVGPLLNSTFSQIKNQTQLYYLDGHAALGYEDNLFDQRRIAFADDNLFKLFSFKLLHGDRSTVLRASDQAVLSESVALRLFGTSNAVGKVFRFSFESGKIENCLVVGIMQDPPYNSHLKLDLAISFSSLEQWTEFEKNAWNWPFYHTYVQLDSKTIDYESFNGQLSQILKGNRPDRSTEGISEVFTLQPVKDIHLKSDLWFEIGQNSDSKNIYFILLIGAFIIMLAYLNYINITTVKSLERAKEVGIRKTLGSGNWQLVFQFLLESLLINLVALLLALLMVKLFIPNFSELTDIPLQRYNPGVEFWGILSALFLFGGMLAAITPSIVLSRNLPSSILSGGQDQSGGNFMRKSLVVLQFAISIFLISGTFTVYQQLQFIKNRDLGIDLTDVLAVNAPRFTDDNIYESKVLAFKKQILSNSSVETFSASGSVPSKWMSEGNMFRTSENDEGSPFNMTEIDFHYFDVYDIKLLAGRNFAEHLTNDLNAVVINMSALKSLGFKNPEEAIGKKVIGFREMEIIGVIEDYNHASLKSEFDPIMFRLNPASKENFSFELNNLEKYTLTQLEETYKQAFPGNPFEYYFVADAFQAQYKPEMNFAKVFGLFTALAVIIASLGLFGLASYIASRRIREVGIRKVLGASSFDIFVLLNRYFMLLILISALLAWPFVLLGANVWLNNFAFKINVGWMILVVPTMIIALIALITMSYQTIKTSMIRPVEILKYE